MGLRTSGCMVGCGWLTTGLSDCRLWSDVSVALSLQSAVVVTNVDRHVKRGWRLRMTKSRIIIYKRVLIVLAEIFVMLRSTHILTTPCIYPPNLLYTQTQTPTNTNTPTQPPTHTITYTPTHTPTHPHTHTYKNSHTHSQTHTITYAPTQSPI